MRPRYTATAERHGPWWAISVSELPGVFSQSRRLDRVEAMARDAIALFLEAPSDSFDVDVREALSPDVERAVHAAIVARAEVLARQEAASATSRAAVRTLADLGLPHRDIGRLLDLSHQRVGQLLGTKPAIGAVGRSRSGQRRPS